MVRTPGKSLPEDAGGVFLLAGAPTLFPEACWWSFSAVKPLLLGRFRRAPSGSRGLLTSLSSCVCVGGLQ